VWVPEQVRDRGDREVARIAAAQKGLVLKEQLVAAGLGRGAIAHRLKNGRLHRRYPGVYLVGRPGIEPLGEEMAAILHFRGHAVLSHQSAAAVWGLTESRGVVLTLVGKDSRSRPGLTIHRAAALDRRDLRSRNGLPVTAPARTVLDLAAVAPDEELEQAIAVARQKRWLPDRELKGAIERAPRHTGAGRLLKLLEDARLGLTRSWAERRMQSLIRAAQLPQPRVNAPLHGYVADFLWSDRRLIVEVDGYWFHGDRAAFERDRKRDQVLVAAGYRVIRVTYRQLRDAPFAVVARVAQALCVGA
jgi:very-short-patch-repair endonuclease